ncbi:MAG: Peptidoglycan-binding lysin domain protein [Herbinix sp.]|nr:Peptidoglycan-binding lysin domain protein [Herbinix sp.]
MIIHVVQPGETINSISALYNIPVGRLILENGINNPDNLVIGQTIVIVQPELVYAIQAGDTLLSIAEQHDVSVMDLLRNNPYLSDREYIYPGETIVISYQTNKIRTIATSGYAFPYINRAVLRKTLPFLSYLTIFNYRVTSEGDIMIGDDDSELIQLAKNYGVAPMMFISTFTREGTSSSEVIFNILNNLKVQDQVIDNTLSILKSKGFYGVNIYAEYINLENIDIVADYLKRAADIFHAEGYRVLITVTPQMNLDSQMISFDKLDYSKLAESVDAVVFASYEWGRSFSFPSSIAPVNVLRGLLDFAVKIVPPKKIFIGLITIGYDWQLPYVPGASVANAITPESAIQIAAEYGATIQFNEAAQAPYFYYMDGEQQLHVIWFKDARSYEAIAGLVPEYGLQGLSIWTIMNFNTQMWFVINTEYDIEKVTNINSPL